MNLFTYSLNLVFRHKLRTLLTSLGIAISVILLTFIIFGMQGLQRVLVEDFTSRFDPNEIVYSKFGFDFVSAPPVDTSDDDGAEEELTIFSPDLVTELEQEDNIERVIPIQIISGMQIELEDVRGKYDNAFISGMDVDADYTYFIDSQGSNTKEDGEVFISSTVLKAFGLEYAEVEGKEVILSVSQTSFLGTPTRDQLDKEYRYTIVGEVDPGADRNDLVISVSDAVEILRDNGGFESEAEFLEIVGYDQLIVLAAEGEVENVKQMISDNYGLEGFTVDDLIEFLDLITVGISLVLTVFASVSALVASLGIINTMVMSIYEQTKEIGLNKAIGASNMQILFVYLIQSGFIGLIGSILGLVMVFSGMLATDGFIVDQLQGAGFQAESFFKFDPIITGVVIIGSIFVGVIAGVYPAFRAALLDPVEALRK